MNLRKSCLPPGWYPHDPEKIAAFLEKTAGERQRDTLNGSFNRVKAAVAPHAGWYYSGDVAARAVSALTADSQKPDTVAVIGGHLPYGMPVLFAGEDAVFSPLGNMEIDMGLREEFENKIRKISGFGTGEDNYRDNTVEVLLPMVKYFFPEAKLLWLRFPADLRSFDAGRILASTAVFLDRKIIALGSTDLTHYGSNYGFSPKGYGRQALDWVKTVNDRRFIDAVEEGNPALVLERAEKEHSACSAGAVLGVMGYMAEIRAAETHGSENSAGRLLAYSTSADITIGEGEPLPDSFVGYGAITWEA